MMAPSVRLCALAGRFKTIMRLNLALYVLIVMNFIPFVGVLKFGWSAEGLLLLYWAETVIIGLLNCAKILACKGERSAALGPETAAQKFQIAGFFTVHFGFFLFVYFRILERYFWPDDLSLLEFDGMLVWGILGFLTTHTVSLFYNFFGRGEYLLLTSRQQMRAPYGRISIMHITLMLGVFIISRTGEVQWSVLVLVVAKTAADIAAHRRSHAIALRT